LEPTQGDDVGMSATVETPGIAQKETGGLLRGLKLFVLIPIAYCFTLVFLSVLFAPPMTQFLQTTFLPRDLFQRVPIMQSLFYHSLALPFTAVLELMTLAAFGARGRMLRFVKWSATVGGMLSSVMMFLVIATGGSTLIYGAMVVGMVVSGASVGGLVITLLPRKEPNAPMRIRGRDLTKLAMLVTLVVASIAVAFGAIASLGNPQWNFYTVEARIMGFEITHASLIMSLVGAAILVLIVKWFGADRYIGTYGRSVKLGLYSVLVGLPAIVIATFDSLYEGTITTGGITIFAAILVQASLFVMYPTMVQEGKRLHVRNPIRLLKESLTFGLLFVLFWVNIAVTMPGMYVGLNAYNFENQYLGAFFMKTFITGHTHMLVTLVAVTVVMLAALMYKVKGAVAAFAGITSTAGYMITSVANFFYMLRLYPNGSYYFEYIAIGITLMLAGVLVALLGIAFSGRGSPGSTAGGRPRFSLLPHPLGGGHQVAAERRHPGD
jgi:hypothetical protein